MTFTDLAWKTIQILPFGIFANFLIYPQRAVYPSHDPVTDHSNLAMVPDCLRQNLEAGNADLAA